MAKYRMIDFCHGSEGFTINHAPVDISDFPTEKKKEYLRPIAKMQGDFKRQGEYASRLVECNNACLPFDNPLEDIKTIKTALKIAQTQIKADLFQHPGDEILKAVKEAVDEASALWKGE